jgi:hypothetical protein
VEPTLGFDLRLITPDPTWTPRRRADYLLRRDVPAVRSVDPYVWIRPPGLPSPLGSLLWTDMAELSAAAGGLVRTATAAVELTAPARLAPERESTSPHRRRLLGYDVADHGLLSGLSNCGYSAADAVALTARWAPQLNDWHLFDDPEAAAGFAAMTDQRVPEHAPFVVYGLYELAPE